MDFPTEGNPISATRASPRRATSNPSLAAVYITMVIELGRREC